MGDPHLNLQTFEALKSLVERLQLVTDEKIIKIGLNF